MIIALTGAGGKTTLGRKLAYELSFLGCRSLFTTTTKFSPPEDDRVYIGPVQNIPSDGVFVTAAKAVLENGKLHGFTPHEIGQIASLFDHIIVEADGAARKPLKAPNDTEPVYPLHTDIVIGVIGLDCLGKPIGDEFVHRASLFAAVTTSQLGGIITVQHLIRLICHANGLFRGAPSEARKIVFLNKYDTIDLTMKDDLTVLAANVPYPVIVASRKTDWFPEFCAAFMEG